MTVYVLFDSWHREMRGIYATHSAAILGRACWIERREREARDEWRERAPKRSRWDYATEDDAAIAARTEAVAELYIEPRQVES